MTALYDKLVYMKSDTEQGILLKSRMAVKREGPVQLVFYYAYIMLPDFFQLDVVDFELDLRHI